VLPTLAQHVADIVGLTAFPAAEHRSPGCREISRKRGVRDRRGSCAEVADRVPEQIAIVTIELNPGLLGFALTVEQLQDT
jgi:hypothetical protein